ncbi:MAG: SPOR domain-containing protein [Rhodocyclaceae bacterium]|nr:SPOR domain-containing protein [Rhodocyclaceae bacterium]
MLRFFLILLLLLNGLALAAWQGWLGQGDTPGEPQRLTNQLQPGHIALLSPAALADALSPAPPPVAPPSAPVVETPPPPPEVPVVPPACVAFVGLADQLAAAMLADAGAQPAFEARDIATTDVTSWWVHLPSLGSKAAAEQRAVTLRSQGVKDLYVVGEGGANPFAISLGLFKSAESANEQRRRLQARGVRGIDIQERGQASHRVEVRGPADALSLWASDWSTRQPDASRLECVP